MILLTHYNNFDRSNVFCFTCSLELIEKSSVLYQVIPRLANRRLIACWIVILLQFWARSIADVWSGNKIRQNRDRSNDGDVELSCEEKNEKVDD